MIDLRSDTVTKPTEAMRRAMASAEVGDDVYGEDPTMNLLEARAAQIFGKEAAVWTPTGSMANTIGLKVNTTHGDEIICEARAHIQDWEFSMAGWFCGCLLRTIETDDGILTWDRIEPKLRPDGPHCSPTTLVELENTHNMHGGTVYPVATIGRICDEAHDRGLKVHMDGARVFNAAAAIDVPVAEITAKVDTVSVCLSKGLGAPAGSLLLGRADTVAKARRMRKRLGGGMRQVGILAAAGLIALEDIPTLLPADHENARLIADRVSEIPGVSIDPAKVTTNIVIFDIAGTGANPAAVSQELKRRGVIINGIGGTRMRAVTHYDVNRADCEEACEILAEVLRPN
ncbi:MAG: aminotransferase class I/II-fold pyridoxal phosphate-dependent enzyme [Acidobacteria bacterium]|nr:aminotransferase class I/II-fold pyridoxal phosphate-dependent enzyme [Acidobacteriota bacterium]